MALQKRQPGDETNTLLALVELLAERHAGSEFFILHSPEGWRAALGRPGTPGVKRIENFEERLSALPYFTTLEEALQELLLSPVKL